MDVSAYVRKQLHDARVFIRDASFILAEAFSQPLWPVMVIFSAVVLAAIGEGTWSEALIIVIATLMVFAISRWFRSRRLNQVHVFWIGLEDLIEDEDYDDDLMGTDGMGQYIWGK